MLVVFHHRDQVVNGVVDINEADVERGEAEPGELRRAVNATMTALARVTDLDM